MSFNSDSVCVNADKFFHMSENPVQWGEEAEGNSMTMVVYIETHKNLQITEVNLRLLDIRANTETSWISV